jgi:uncharacterized membrane protein YqjE
MKKLTKIFAIMYTIYVVIFLIIACISLVIYGNKSPYFINVMGNIMVCLLPILIIFGIGVNFNSIKEEIIEFLN